MKTFKKQLNSFYSSHFILGLVSIFALTATFLVSNFGISFSLKAAVFASIVAIYLSFFIVIIYRQNRPADINESQIDKAVFGAETDEKLLILEEASQFFGASLKFADMFRLVAGRISELLPFAACALFLPDEDKVHLRIAHISGENLQLLKNLKIKCTEGLAGKTYLSGEPQSDEKLQLDKTAIPTISQNGFNSAISVPLERGGEVFAVLQLYGNAEKAFDQNNLPLLEAVGERVAPLLSGSMAFERTLSNALTDALTNLPNERAFYLMLENQIAESQRLPEKQQLTVLVMDIKNFAALNSRFGHAAGDRMLAFAAKIIKDQLRRMDFLSRSMNDEFFAVLPTASEEITETIIKRVERAFVLSPFEVTDQEKIHLQLSFGAASFLNDGDTAQKLLQTALIKKQQAKAPQRSQVLFFPKEYVN